MGVWGIHKTIEAHWTQMTVPHEVAQVHHYRTQCAQDYWHHNDCGVLEVDDTALCYKRELIDNHRHTYRAIFGTDGRTEHEVTNATTILIG